MEGQRGPREHEARGEIVFQNSLINACRVQNVELFRVKWALLKVLSKVIYIYDK